MRDIGLDQLVRSPPHLPEQLDPSVLPVDKPEGLTSFDVIRKLRRVLRVRKMGHAGTLDPMATGLLIVLVGAATKLQQRFMDLDKEYRGVLRLGEITASFDAETEVDIRKDPSHITEEDVERARRRFVGSIRQQTPPYSAVKRGGERLYKKARRGENVQAPLRDVFIADFSILYRSGADLAFTVRCSKGTYIRSLAHEFGMELGVGAHLVSLMRTAIGPFHVADAWNISDLQQAADRAFSND